MSIQNIYYTGYEGLATAVVKSAADDYRKELKKLKALERRYARTDGDTEKVERDIASQKMKLGLIEEFFLWSPFITFLGANGRYIIQRLRKEVA